MLKTALASLAVFAAGALVGSPIAGHLRATQPSAQPHVVGFIWTGTYEVVLFQTASGFSECGYDAQGSRRYCASVQGPG